MTLNDLKTGMVVRTRNNGWYLVMRNTSELGDCMLNLITKQTYMMLCQYNDDMLCKSVKEYDIMVVYDLDDASDLFSVTSASPSNLEITVCTSSSVVYDREERKHMTIEEIEAELGYKITIVN